MSEKPEVDPVDIQTPEQGVAFGFLIEEEYGNEHYAASYMPLDEAERIIRKCAEEYSRRASSGNL